MIFIVGRCIPYVTHTQYTYKTEDKLLYRRKKQKQKKKKLINKKKERKKERKSVESQKYVILVINIFITLLTNLPCLHYSQSV